MVVQEDETLWIERNGMGRDVTCMTGSHLLDPVPQQVSAQSLHWNATSGARSHRSPHHQNLVLCDEDVAKCRVSILRVSRAQVI